MMIVRDLIMNGQDFHDDRLRFYHINSGVL